MSKFYARLTRVVYVLGYPLFGLILHNSRRVRVLVRSNGSIVLLKTSVGRQEWALPGGGIEKHESDVAAAIRETQEETGLAVKPEQLTLLGEESGKIYRNRNWPRVQFVFYEANVLNKPILKIVRPLEIIELAWFKEDQLPAKSSREVTQALALLKSKK